MTETTNVLHGENFGVVRMPLVGSRCARALDASAARVLRQTESSDDPDVSVVVRTRNNRRQLLGLFEDLAVQEYKGGVQLIVVDTESTDGTADVARAHGASVVPIEQATFTYPNSLNWGFDRADCNWVFTLVGHSALSNRATLKLATLYDGVEDIGGVFGGSLPNANATRAERMGAMALGMPKKLAALPSPAKIGDSSLLAGTSSMVSREVWQQLCGYDPYREAGGEDYDLGRKMIEDGRMVVRHPVLSVYHTHGLGLRAAYRQLQEWQRVREPAEFDLARLSFRRDLDL